MKVRLSIAVLLAVLTSLAMPAAAAEIVTVVATGIGNSRPQAVTAALAEAVQRATGVSVDQAMLSGLVVGTSQIEGQANRIGPLGSDSTEGRLVRTDTVGQDLIATRSGSSVRSYTEISSTKDGLGRYVVKLSVDVDKFKAVMPETAKRVRLVVAQFRSEDSAFSTALRERLMVQFVQGRKFSVLDRTESAEYRNEMAIATSIDAGLPERVRHGQTLGADFVVTGGIKLVPIRQEEVDPITKARSVRLSTIAEVSYSTIEIATRQIQWSNIVQIRVPGQPPQLVDKLASVIANEITELLYPIHAILTETPGTVIVSQGGQTLETGERLTLMALGPPVLDPDTKETLGRRQTEIGMVEITRVDAAMASARVVSGSIDKNSELILRRRPPSPQPSVPTQKNLGTQSKAFD